MISLLLTVLFLLFSIKSLLFWINLWQLKEYRLDRLWIHLRDTHQGKELLFSIDLALLCFGILLFSLSIVSDGIAFWYQYIVLSILVLLDIPVLFSFIQHKLKKPIFTPKAAGIFFLSLCVLIGALMLPLVDFSFWLIFLSLCIPFIVVFFVFFLAFPTEIYTDYLLQKAKSKRLKLKKLQVIAVSGSYGKSSTKEAIAQVLSKKFNVVKTHASNNTALAIAKTLLNEVNQSTDFFVVEMGAYKRGEIAQLASFTLPTISVTTSVSDQHLALYGNMNNVVLSEFELIEALPKQAIVLLNKNSTGVSLLSEKIKSKHIVWYERVKNSKKSNNTIIGYSLQTTTNGTKWECSINGKNVHFSTPLLGTHVVENILPAIFLGIHFGMSEKQIQDAVNSLIPLPKTMQKISLFNGITTIDDSFNASPESVASAVDFLLLAPKRKILVTSPLIELGENARERHINLGKKLASIDIVLLTNKNFYKEIHLGLKEENAKTQVYTGRYVQLAEKLREIMKSHDTIVFEGKEAGIILKQL